MWPARTDTPASAACSASEPAPLANGSYDLGDFRAFVLANPDLEGATRPVSAPAKVVVPLTFREGGSP